MAEADEQKPQTPEVPEGGGEVETPNPAPETPAGPTVEELQAALDAERTALSEAAQRAARAERELTRFKVAARFGLPEDLAARLIGETEEEMTADAKTLAKYAQRGTIGLGVGGLEPNTPTPDSAAEIVSRIRKNPL